MVRRTAPRGCHPTGVSRRSWPSAALVATAFPGSGATPDDQRAGHVRLSLDHRSLEFSIARAQGGRRSLARRHPRLLTPPRRRAPRTPTPPRWPASSHHLPGDLREHRLPRVLVASRASGLPGSRRQVIEPARRIRHPALHGHRRSPGSGRPGPREARRRSTSTVATSRPSTRTRAASLSRGCCISASFATERAHTFVIEVLGTRGHPTVAIDELVVRGRTSRMSRRPPVTRPRPAARQPRPQPQPPPRRRRRPARPRRCTSPR